MRRHMSDISPVLHRTLSLARVVEFDAPVTGLVFLADGTLVTGLGDGTVRLIGVAAKPMAVQTHTDGSAVLALRADLDGKSVLTGGDDGCLARTDRAGTTMTLAKFPGHQIDVLTISAASGLRAVAAGRGVHMLDRAARTVASSEDHPSTVSDLAFNPKGKRLAVAHYGGATVWGVTTFGRNAARFKWAGSHLRVTWSPDGSTVLTSMQDAELHGWRVSDHQDLRMQGYPTKIYSLEWLMKPMTLLTSGADRVIGWRFADGGPMGRPPLEIGRGMGRVVTRVAVNPKQPIVAAGFDDGHVAVCSLFDDEMINSCTSARDSVEALAWSGDGARLAAGTRGGHIQMFETPRQLS
jgi:WD40 repeat protein